MQDVWLRLGEFVTLQYQFLTLCILGSLLVGLLGGLLGPYLVSKRLSLMGDAIGHATLPGIGLAFLLVGSKALGALYVGALAAGLLCAYLIGFVTKHSRTRPDAALGLMFTGFFGFGIVLLSYIQNSGHGQQSGLNAFLVGNAIAISPEQVTILAVLFGLTFVAIATLYRPLLLSTFDPALAQTMGLPVGWLHLGVLLFVSLAIVASIQATGVVLVAAMLIMPAATAHLLCHRFHQVLAVSALIGAFSGVAGALLSYLFRGWASGPSMVLVASSLFVMAFLFAPEHGLLTKKQAVAHA